jgi:hypothetical protein
MVRLIRFRLRTLLALPIVFAAVWWWVTWPERSAHRFVDLLAAGDVKAARAMIDGDQPTAAFWKIVSSGRFAFARLKYQPASWSECLRGERTFDFEWEFDSRDGGLGPFVARRNRVSLGPPSIRGSYVMVYALHGELADTIVTELASLYPDTDEHRVRADVGGQQLIVVGTDRTHSESRALIRLAEVEARP